MSAIAKIPVRPLGSQGLRVSAQGLGCMGMTAFYVADPTAHEDSAMATFDAAQKAGVTFLDTAWIYQHPSGACNEALVARAIAKYGRSAWTIATKFGIAPGGPGGKNLDSSPARIRSQLADSLSRLGTDYIDLYYQHRQDPDVPIETVMATLAELVKDGVIKYIGLSEVSGDELRRAHAVHPVTAIQMEWSLQTRDLEASVVPVARELGVGIVAYSPLGRGLLTASMTSREHVKGDWRASNPRFAEDVFDENAAAGARLAEAAAKRGATAAQLALAWVQAQGEDVFPIPGTKTPERLLENAAAVALGASLSKEDVAAIAALVPEAKGDRYTGLAGTWNSRAL